MLGVLPAARVGGQPAQLESMRTSSPSVEPGYIISPGLLATRHSTLVRVLDPLI